MSMQLFRSDILFFQRLLTVSGFYKGPLDGKWSLAVDKAENAFELDYIATRDVFGTLDSRSERNISTLLPKAQRKARECQRIAQSFPYECRIISGTRTYAEQNKLFTIGRTTELSRSPVTKARGGRSNHNFGMAWDVGLFHNGRYMDRKSDRPAYGELAALLKQHVTDHEWGGDWRSFPDGPHYQLRTDFDIPTVRANFEAGKAYA